MSLKLPDWIDADARRTLLFLLISGVALALSFFPAAAALPFDPSWVAIVLCGLPILKEAAEGLFTRFDIKADVLVSMALIASVVIGETFAAGEIAWIMTIGSLLEELTVEKARAGVAELAKLSPEKARVIRDGVETVVPAGEVLTGDLVRVLPGEKIPADGILLEGATAIDESVMTGEPMPVDKKPGDELLSGTINRFGAFVMRATDVGEKKRREPPHRTCEERRCGTRQDRPARRPLGDLDRRGGARFGRRHLVRDGRSRARRHDSRRLLSVRLGACDAHGRHGRNRERHATGLPRAGGRRTRAPFLRHQGRL